MASGSMHDRHKSFERHLSEINKALIDPIWIYNTKVKIALASFLTIFTTRKQCSKYDFFSLSCSPALLRLPGERRMHLRPRFLQLEKHLNRRLWMASGNTGEEAGEPPRQDIRGSGGIRVLWHLQYWNKVRLNLTKRADDKVQEFHIRSLSVWVTSILEIRVPNKFD